MKAVVVEIKNNRAAVLSDDGCVIAVKNKNYEIGQVLHINPSRVSIPKRIATIAATAAAFVVLSIGTWAYASPYAYVSLDINPSLEFTLNRFDMVLSVKAVNDDGEELLKNISLSSLENKSIEKALLQSVEQLTVSGFLMKDSDNGIVIATSSGNSEKAEVLALELQETVGQKVTQGGNEIEIEAFSVEPECVEEAKQLGVTPGKLNLVEKLQAAAPDTESIDIEDWLEKPVKDIMKATKEYKSISQYSETSSSLDSQADASESKAEESKDNKASKKDEKDARKADKDAKKDEKKADKANKNAKKDEKESDKADRNANKNDKKADKEADKADKNAKRDEKESDKAEQNAKKDDKKADKETDKADRNAKKDENNADKESDKNNEKKDNSDSSDKSKNNKNDYNKNTKTSNQNKDNQERSNSNEFDKKSSNNDSNKGYDRSDSHKEPNKKGR